MADADSNRLQNLTTMGQIERAIGTQNFGFVYGAGHAIVGVKFSGQTLSARELLQKIDAEEARAARE